MGAPLNRFQRRLRTALRAEILRAAPLRMTVAREWLKASSPLLRPEPLRRLVALVIPRQVLERVVVAEGARRGPGHWGRPADGVREDAADLFVVVRRVRLVSGAKVEDFAFTALVAAAAAEDLS